MLTEHGGVAATFTQESQRTKKKRLLSKCLETQICENCTYENVKNRKEATFAPTDAEFQTRMLWSPCRNSRFYKRAKFCFLPPSSSHVLLQSAESLRDDCGDGCL